MSQEHEEKLIALKEAAWQGRAGGFDIERAAEMEVLRDTLRMKKKNPQRSVLPPLSTDNSNNAVSRHRVI